MHEELMTMNEELMRFMVGRLGGEDKVLREFHREEVKGAILAGGTLAEVEQRLQGAALDVYKALPVAELVGMVEKDVKAGDSKTARKRSTQAELVVAKDAILLTLKEHQGPIRISDLAERVGFDKRVCGRILKDLRSEGKAVRVGEKSKAAWLLAA